MKNSNHINKTNDALKYSTIAMIVLYKYDHGVSIINSWLRYARQFMLPHQKHMLQQLLLAVTPLLCLQIDQTIKIMMVHTSLQLRSNNFNKL